MPDLLRLPKWALALGAALAILGLARGLIVVQHDPLLAIANSYDQIRYTTCIDLAPWRPGVQADRSNPPAPYSRFAFQPLPKGTCIWTSDLVFTAPTALAWRIAERLGGRPIHSVRRLADLRFLAWLAVAAFGAWFFVRERRVDLALAHLAAFAVVAMDPANTLYLATFYAEAAAVFGLYACLVGIATALVRPTRGAIALTAIGALMLATSKYQHLILPLVLAAAVLLGARRAGSKVALALAIAGLVGFGVQLANGMQPTLMASNIARVNRADYTLLVLLPETSDRERIVTTLDIDQACLEYSGKSVYAMKLPVERICKTVDRWHRTTLWWLLVADPPALGRALLHIPNLLLPWVPEYLGVIEGGDNARPPASAPTLSALFARSIAFAWFLLLLPWLVLAGCFVRPASSLARAFALSCAAGVASVAVASLLGDGDVEFAKHAHLTINFALASLCVPFAALMQRMLAKDGRG
ncbi:MAG TPA: hypothetical protein VGO25_02680 [Rhodanobacteraceae bacterium]|nr:hypothetical protein [Rhodanobacteraceae bacterium]